MANIIVGKSARGHKSACGYVSVMGEGLSSNCRQSTMTEFFTRGLPATSTLVRKKGKKATFAECSFGSCKECRKVTAAQSVHESVTMLVPTVPIGESVVSVPAVEPAPVLPVESSVPSVPVVQANTGQNW